MTPCSKQFHFRNSDESINFLRGRNSFIFEEWNMGHSSHNFSLTPSTMCRLIGGTHFHVTTLFWSTTTDDQQLLGWVKYRFTSSFSTTDLPKLIVKWVAHASRAASLLLVFDWLQSETSFRFYKESLQSHCLTTMWEFRKNCVCFICPSKRRQLTTMKYSNRVVPCNASFSETCTVPSLGIFKKGHDTMRETTTFGLCRYLIGGTTIICDHPTDFFQTFATFARGFQWMMWTEINDSNSCSAYEMQETVVSMIVSNWWSIEITRSRRFGFRIFLCRKPKTYAMLIIGSLKDAQRNDWWNCKRMTSDSKIDKHLVVSIYPKIDLSCW